MLSYRQEAVAVGQLFKWRSWYWWVLAILATAATVALFTPYSGDPLPAKQTIVNVTPVQNTAGRITDYQLQAANGKHYSVDRSVYAQFVAYHDQGLTTADVNQQQTTTAQSQFSLAALFAVFALACWVAALLPRFTRRQERPGWRPAISRGLWTAVIILAAYALLGRAALRAVVVQQEAKNAPSLIAQVTKKTKTNAFAYTLSMADREVTLRYVMNGAELTVQQAVGASTYAHLKKGQTVHVAPLTRNDQAVALAQPKGTVNVVDWLSDSWFTSLVLVVVIGGYAWWRWQISGIDDAPVDPVTTAAAGSADPPTRRRAGRQPSWRPLTITAGVFVVVGLGFWGYVPHSTTAAPTEAKSATTSKAAKAAGAAISPSAGAKVVVSTTYVRKQIMKNVPKAPASTTGAQYALFDALTSRWAPLLTDVLNDHSMTTAQLKQQATLAATEAGTIQARTGAEGQALTTYAKGVQELIAFRQTATKAEREYYTNEYAIYLSAEALWLCHQFYGDKVPATLTALSKVDSDVWADPTRATSAYNENQQRWAYAEQLKTKAQIEASKTPIKTLLDTEDLANSSYLYQDVKAKDRTVTTPTLKITLGMGTRIGKDLYVPYTLTNRTKHAYISTDALQTFGVGFTQKADKKYDNDLTIGVYTKGLTKTQRAYQNLGDGYLLPGRSATVALVITGITASKPMYEVIGGGDNPVISSILLYQPAN